MAYGNDLKFFVKENHVDCSFPPIEYCTDNAAMIGAAGYFAYLDGRRADLTLNSVSSSELKVRCLE